MIEDELEFTSKWLTTHVSDHSAVHHRNKVVGRKLELLEEESQVRFMDELSLKSCQLIQQYPGHEALWLHKYHLISTLGAHFDGQSDLHEMVDQGLGEIEEDVVARVEGEEDLEEIMEGLISVTISPSSDPPSIPSILKRELQFARLCISDDGSWEFGKQQVFGLRSLYSILISFHTLDLADKVGQIQSISGLPPPINQGLELFIQSLL